MLEQPFVRRAPWLEDVLPATRELMQALQVCVLLFCAALCECSAEGNALRGSCLYTTKGFVQHMILVDQTG